MKPIVYPRRPGHSSRLLAATVLTAAAAAVFAASSAHGQTTVTSFASRPLFTLTAAAPATNTFGFERNFSTATGSGSLGTFTEAGIVTFNVGTNYIQQIIDGSNVGQGVNDVYVSQATNKADETANLTFGVGVLSLGFDFKNTASGLAGGAGTVPQSFTFSLFSDGGASLGNFTSSTVPDGSTFQFLGFTSTVPITRMIIVATIPNSGSNLDIVLDNFAVANPVPEPGTVAMVSLGLLGLLAGRRGLRRGGQV